MKLADVAPHINPDGDSVVCHDVAPMPYQVGLIVLCDRTPRHTGKHRHKSPKGRIEWWGESVLKGEQ